MTKLRKHENQWVAIYESGETEMIVGSGSNAIEATHEAEAKGFYDPILFKVLPTKIIKSAVLLFLLAISLFAQDKQKPRVFITDSQSWEISGGFGGVKDGGGGKLRGGARPQTAEIIKTFGERCPECIVTMSKEKADYIVLLDHEGGKGALRKDNKFAVFNKDGDAIKSGSTRSLGNAVKDACNALKKDWQPSDTKTESSKSKGLVKPMATH